MPKFEVRKNCEFIIVVEAADRQAAVIEAATHENVEWAQAWASYTVEIEGNNA